MRMFFIKKRTSLSTLAKPSEICRLSNNIDGFSQSNNIAYLPKKDFFKSTYFLYVEIFKDLNSSMAYKWTTEL